MQTNKAIRKNAAEKLFENGNLYVMALGICLCIAVAVSPVILFALISSLAYNLPSSISPLLDLAAIFVLLVLFIFVTVPVIGSFFDMCYRLYRGYQAHVAEVLAPFTMGRRYFAMLRIYLSFLLRLLSPLLVLLAAFFITRLAEIILADLVILLFLVRPAIVLIEVAAFVTVVFFNSSIFFAPYLMCQGYTPRMAVATSRRLTSGKWGKVWGYMLGFSGLLALSVLTVGMLFVIYVAPLMIFAYFIYAEQMINNSHNNIERGNENEG